MWTSFFNELIQEGPRGFVASRAQVKLCLIDCRVDVRMAADSTMLRMVNLLIALSLGVQREQLLHRMGLVWPRPFLLRPL